MSHYYKILKQVQDDILRFDFLPNRTLKYNDGNFDVELHPAFDTLFRLAKESKHQNSTIEPPKTQQNCTKKAPEGANFNNGGNDEARTRDLMRDRHAL